MLTAASLDRLGFRQRIWSVNERNARNSVPFVLERDGHMDEFNRRPLARALAEALIEHERDRLPLNVGIFGAWGTGKTQFMEMIDEEVVSLSLPKPKVVWFRPWKYESRQDVGTGLMLAITRSVEEDSNAGAEVKELAKIAGLFLWKVFRKTAVEVVNTLGPTDLGTAIDESIGEIRDESPNIQTEIDKALDQLHDVIRQWVGDDGRCFVFVDDLDRCLPAQMITLVEAVHLYMVDAPCYFTVGMDRGAISAALRDRYPRLDAELGRVYLDKIFPVSMNLSPPTNDQLIARYQRSLSAEDLTDPQIDFVLENLEQNPRAVERFVNNYSLARRLLRTKPGLFDVKSADLLILLTIIRTQYPVLFEAMQKVPRTAITQFVKHTRAQDPSALKRSLDATRGNALMPFAAEGTTTRAFVNTLPTEWHNVLERAHNIESILAFADV